MLCDYVLSFVLFNVACEVLSRMLISMSSVSTSRKSPLSLWNRVEMEMSSWVKNSSQSWSNSTKPTENNVRQLVPPSTTKSSINFDRTQKQNWFDNSARLPGIVFEVLYINVTPHLKSERLHWSSLTQYISVKFLLQPVCYRNLINRR